MTVTVYTFPTSLIVGNIADATFYIDSLFLSSTAPNSRYTRVSGPLDARWMAKMRFNKLSEDEWNDIEAFFHKIDQYGGFFSFFDPSKQIPRGAQVNDPTTDSAYLTGEVATSATRGATSVHLKGLKTSTTDVLKANDHISITHGASGHQLLYAITDDASSDGSGEATVNIKPALQAPVAAGSPGDTVTFYQARGAFRLRPGKPVAVQKIPAMLGNASLDIIGTPEVAFL